MLNKLLSILIIYSWSILAWSQEVKVTTNTGAELKNYRTNVTKVSLILGAGTFVAFTLDKPLNNWLQNHQGDFGNTYAGLFNEFGEKLVIVPAVGLSWATGYVFKDDKLRTTSWNAIKSIATTAVATEVLKISTGRARPFTGEGASSFHPFNGQDYYKSLPSGHVALAFAAFTPYAETYSRWLYIIPASVAFSRVYKNKHWLSDTVIGGGLGFLSGWIFTHHPRKNIQLTGNGLIVLF